MKYKVGVANFIDGFRPYTYNKHGMWFFPTTLDGAFLNSDDAYSYAYHLLRDDKKKQKKRWWEFWL